MKPFFKSPVLQQQFDKDGFVHVPFLTSEETDELMECYTTIETEHQQIAIPFITTSHSNNHALIRKADEIIASVFKPHMDNLFFDYNLLFGNFLIKQPDPNSVTSPHQDTTFVDEKEFSSISVWVSLQDTDKKNGCMRFVKGSHKFKFTLRPSHAYPWHFENVKDKIEKLLTDYPSKKGEAFIFHHGVIHASYANLTDKPRVAALMAAYPFSAELFMLFQNTEGGKTIQKYKMTREAYLHFVKGQPPAMGELIGEEKADFAPFTQNDLELIAPSSSSLFSKIKKYFLL